jgi:hypothetical protein
MVGTVKDLVGEHQLSLTKPHVPCELTPQIALVYVKRRHIHWLKNVNSRTTPPNLNRALTSRRIRTPSPNPGC